MNGIINVEFYWIMSPPSKRKADVCFMEASKARSAS